MRGHVDNYKAAVGTGTCANLMKNDVANYSRLDLKNRRTMESNQWNQYVYFVYT